MRNPDKICWRWFSKNPSAIEVLEQNQDKIDWGTISGNPSIFTYDYERIRDVKSGELECIQAYFNHSRFVEEFLHVHDTDELDDFEEWFLNRHVC